MKRMKLKRFLVSIILIIVTLTSFNNLSLADASVRYIDSTEYKSTYLIMDENISLDKSKYEVMQELIAEVKYYINRQAPSAYSGIPEFLVKECLENNIDICFAMSQTQNETNFGVAGAGRSSSRRSLFGVCKRHYSSYENAITDYINLLKTKYLVNGKTEQSLLKKYVNANGHRYADEGYEKHLSKTYNQIRRSTNIYKLQQHYLEM